MNPADTVVVLGQTLTVRQLMWWGVGFIGQGLFFSRFVVQWLASEKAKKSVVPVAFWYFSIIGGLITLVYAWWGEHSLPFTVGQAVGLFVYSRNLALIRKERSAAQEGSEDA